MGVKGLLKGCGRLEMGVQGLRWKKGFNRVCRLEMVMNRNTIGGCEGLRWVRRTLGWCRGPEMGVNGIR